MSVGPSGTSLSMANMTLLKHQEHHVTLGQAGQADTEERDQEEDSGDDDGQLPAKEF